MKPTFLIITVLATFLAGAIGLTVLRNSATTSTRIAPQDLTPIMDKNQDNTNAPAMLSGQETRAAMPATHGTYAPFSPELLTSAASTLRVLFFYANWCPTCRPADVSFADNITQIPNDVTLLRVNYNDTQTDETEKELAQQYGVTYQHTFVQIDSDGNVVTKWNGGQLDELLSNIR